MKTRAMIVAVLCLAGTAFAQSIDYTMHRGDILVYQENYSGDISIVELRSWNNPNTQLGDPIEEARINTYMHWVKPYFRGFASGDYIIVLPQSIDSNGIVYQTGIASFKDIQLFPTSVPSTDTLLLINDQWGNGPDLTYNYRAFDTVIYQTPVKAISFLRVHADTVTEVTVSDVFGLVRARNEHTDWQLSSATIAKLKYNHDTRKFAAFPTCEGAEFVYKRTYPITPTGPDSSIIRYTLRDTLIHGEQYYKPEYMLWHAVGGNPYRVADGVVYMYDGMGEIMLDTSMSLGARSSEGIIGDTGTVLFAGETRRYIASVPKGDEFMWIEGIGLVSHIRHPIGGAWPFETELVYANICGEEYGTPVGINEPPAVESHHFSAPYPNPVSVTRGSVQVTASRPVRGPLHVALYDALGRKVYTKSFEDGDMRTRFILPLQSVTPGVYYLSLRGTHTNESSTLVVLR